jgi:hypothetical protein
LGLVPRLLGFWVAWDSGACFWCISAAVRCQKKKFHLQPRPCPPPPREEEEEEEEEEFFNHYKNDLKRHAHTPSGVAGADLKS